MIITDEGISPSLIVNTVSVIKRETYGQLLEPTLNEWMIGYNGNVMDEVGGIS